MPFSRIFFTFMRFVIYPFYDFTAKWMFYDFTTFYSIDASLLVLSHFCTCFLERASGTWFLIFNENVWKTFFMILTLASFNLLALHNVILKCGFVNFHWIDISVDALYVTSFSTFWKTWATTKKQSKHPGKVQNKLEASPRMLLSL